MIESQVEVSFSLKGAPGYLGPWLQEYAGSGSYGRFRDEHGTTYLHALIGTRGSGGMHLAMKGYVVDDDGVVAVYDFPRYAIEFRMHPVGEVVEVTAICRAAPAEGFFLGLLERMHEVWPEAAV